MKLQAVLLLGPTGSGKSPLGDWLENVSLWGRRCHHFDFGANLRAVVADQSAGAFTVEEIQFFRRVLEAGALLEDEQFPLAVRILDSFIEQKRVQPDDLLVLNGLPRHRQQARMLDERIRALSVIQLECDARTVAERLRRNSGGDRTQRQDDSEALVARKLSIYENRTRPLLSYYREQGASVVSISVGIETRPPEIAERIEHWRRQLPAAL